MRTFLQAGVPLGKLDVFRELLEENSYQLCHRRHLFDLIPFILNEEITQIKNEIKGKFLGLVLCLMGLHIHVKL